MADLSKHDLGHVDQELLSEEVNHAERMVKEAISALARREYSHAMNEFFRSGAVATNVIFTAKTHKTPIPRRDLDRCKKVIDLSTNGIKKIVGMVAYQKVRKHERRMHKGQK